MCDCFSRCFPVSLQRVSSHSARRSHCSHGNRRRAGLSWWLPASRLPCGCFIGGQHDDDDEIESLPFARILIERKRMLSIGRRARTSSALRWRRRMRRWWRIPLRRGRRCLESIARQRLGHCCWVDEREKRQDLRFRSR